MCYKVGSEFEITAMFSVKRGLFVKIYPPWRWYGLATLFDLELIRMSRRKFKLWEKNELSWWLLLFLSQTPSVRGPKWNESLFYFRMLSANNQMMAKRSLVVGVMMAYLMVLAQGKNEIEKSTDIQEIAIQLLGGWLQEARYNQAGIWDDDDDWLGINASKSMWFCQIISNHAPRDRGKQIEHFVVHATDLMSHQSVHVVINSIMFDKHLSKNIKDVLSNFPPLQ